MRDCVEVGECFRTTRQFKRFPIFTPLHGVSGILLHPGVNPSNCLRRFFAVAALCSSFGKVSKLLLNSPRQRRGYLPWIRRNHCGEQEMLRGAKQMR